jgi:hypothetical protein
MPGLQQGRGRAGSAEGVVTTFAPGDQVEALTTLVGGTRAKPVVDTSWRRGEVLWTDGGVVCVRVGDRHHWCTPREVRDAAPAVVFCPACVDGVQANGEQCWDCGASGRVAS